MDKYTQNRRNLIKETRELYYDSDFQPLPSRAVTAAGCLYRTRDGRMCALGRLKPNALWVFGGIDKKMNPQNYNIVLEILMELELCAPDDEAFGISFLGHLQDFHDCPDRAAEKYVELLQDFGSE